MNSEVQDLAQILKAEVDLMAALTGVMQEKQQAIVRFQGDLLADCTQREEELMQPLEALEDERIKRSAALASMLQPSVDGRKARPLPLRDLVSRLKGDEAVSLGELAEQLQSSVQRILEVNGHNRLLLQHSLRFVKQTLRIITDDHRKQLIDERM
jgi:flagellar biosynthesis/type III secretory pathway chaperone